MGCICSKGASRIKKCRGKVKESKKSSSKRSIASSKKEDVVVEVDNGANDATTRLISTENVDKSTGSTPPSRDEVEKSSLVLEKPMEPQISRRGATADGIAGGQPKISRVFSVRNGLDGAQIVAGWPPWLTAVAGEAIKGWVPRRADSFEKLDKIGQGTYSSVYRARDLETGKIVALKKVRFVDADPESVRFMSREILILRRLDHPNIMKLEGLVTSRVSCNLYLVFEYMEHDLAGLAGSQKAKFTEAQIKCFMQQLLRGLEHCHKCGVLHRDIKGSNLLIDNNGNLKIGDFGLATFYRTNQKQTLTSRVVTLWYRPPELLLGATDYGPTVDLWSAGCILAELFVGKPIMPGRTEVEQLHKIFKLCGSPSEEYWKNSKLPHATIFKPQQPYKRVVTETFKNFPSTALALLDILLAFDPLSRGSTTSALQDDVKFFTKMPLPCDPSMLPKFPPSKEFDVKARDEEARRKKVDSSKGRGSDGRSFNESRAVPAPDANAELPASIQKYKGLTNSKGNNSEQYNSEEGGGTKFPIDLAGRSSFKGVLGENGASRGSIAMHANGAGLHVISQVYSSGHSGGELRTQRSYNPQGGAAQLSRFSNSVAGHGSSHLDQSRGDSTHSQWRMEQLNSKYNASDSLLGLPSSLCKKDEAAARQERIAGACSPKKTKMHYSGPLFSAAGNLDEMLKKHERNIQEAVRRARIDKNKNIKGCRDNGQAESLLQYVGNGR